MAANHHEERIISQLQESTSSPELTRRRFLQSTGVAAALTCGMAGLKLPLAAAAAAGEPAGANALKLSLASYTTRKLSLDKTIAVAKRVGLKNICLKSVHLPLEAKPEETAATAAKVRAAGLNLYGGGNIAMVKEAQINQAFDYAQCRGVRADGLCASAEMLPLIEKKVKEFNIAIAIHNHGPSDKHFPTPESAYEKIKNLDKRMGLCIDIGHTVRAKVDLIAQTKMCIDRLYDVHMKDLTPAFKDVPVGRGVIDITGFLRHPRAGQIPRQGVVRVRSRCRRSSAGIGRIGRLYTRCFGGDLILHSICKPTDRLSVGFVIFSRLCQRIQICEHGLVAGLFHLAQIRSITWNWGSTTYRQDGCPRKSKAARFSMAWSTARPTVSRNHSRCQRPSRNAPMSLTGLMGTSIRPSG